MTSEIPQSDTGDGFVGITRHQGLLGTVVELQIAADTEAEAESIDEAVSGEMRRLEGVFDIYDPDSEISVWRRAESAAGAELSAVLALAAEWWERSGGAFNPAVGVFTELWSVAAGHGEVPSAQERQQLAAAIRRLPYRVDDGLVAALGPLDAINLNAIAKGWIVDQAGAKGQEFGGLKSLTVNAGGDLLHRGPALLIVGIEDPKRSYDNVPPLLRIAVGDGALATSGGSRRGWEIDGRWYGHVIDPRTGDPVDHVASASVIASTAATADVVATILTVLAAEEAMGFAATLDGVGACLINQEGSIVRNDVWAAAEV